MGILHVTRTAKAVRRLNVSTPAPWDLGPWVRAGAAGVPWYKRLFQPKERGMRQKLLWCCALAGCCLGGSAGETEGIAIPPSIQALNVDVDGDGVASTADKLLLALWVQMGGDLEAALASATVTKDGLIQMGNLLQIAPGAEIQGSSDPVTPTSGGRGSAEFDFVTAVFLLAYLQAGGPAPGCMDAGDVNDDGQIDIADPVWLLSYVFASGPPPEPPFPGCGRDPTPDNLTCDVYDEALCGEL